ncbi:variant erythrocyte surface antigen-1, alpha subunit [Babesia caballi]|uniref:Variant erythrocyte surface antigen-1, alpha subunit n=1 Tax=Babesia caballi TaxID=5871 RepID=A0AAV4LZW9_BABCB|nr:variant erythrocyte surface antigen-1, alpha subunit [Babesia caballi]
MGYSSSILNGSKSGNVVQNVVKEKFAGFEAAWPNKKSYYDFHTTLHKTIPENFNNQTNSADAIRALYYCASYYFTYKHSTISAPTNSPSNIREMLYFLAALPFSHSYDEFDKYITQHFKIIVGHPDSPIMSDAELMIPVADASSVNTNNTLSADHIKEYLTSTILLPPVLLGVIQGSSTSEYP